MSGGRSAGSEDANAWVHALSFVFTKSIAVPAAKCRREVVLLDVAMTQRSTSIVSDGRYHIPWTDFKARLLHSKTNGGADKVSWGPSHRELSENVSFDIFVVFVVDKCSFGNQSCVGDIQFRLRVLRSCRRCQV